MIIQAKTFDNTTISVEVQGSTISKVTPLKTDTMNALPLIAPGLVDLQVNGYNGIDFNSGKVSKDDALECIEALFKQGITGFCPTIITNSDDYITEMFSHLNALKASDERINCSFAGYHLEGPFISPKDGPRGAHSKEFVQAPNVDLLKKWNQTSEGNLKILTLSPEWEDGLEDVIHYCVNHNIKASIGHTSATPQQISNAVKMGASMSTHLGNGCDLQIHRHNNYIWQQLAEDNLCTAIISDGFHLPDAVLKVILRAKNDKVIITSDTTSFGGCAPGTYKTHIGGEVVLTPEGKLHLASNSELLAGSAQSLLECVNVLIQKKLLSREDAWTKASTVPSMFMNFDDRGSIQASKNADFVLLDDTGEQLSLLSTYQGGQAVYTA